MRRYLTFSGGLIALICFFLPWGNTQCEGKATSSNSFPFSGFSLASFSWDWTFLWIIMVLAIFIIVLVALKPERSRIPVLLSSIAGLVLMFIALHRLNVGTKEEGEAGFKFLGFTGSIVGFLLALIGSFFSINRDTSHL